MVRKGSLTAVLTLRPHAVVPRPLDAAAAVVGLRTPPTGWAGVQLTGITHDSREVRPGDLYAALPGASDHGARFADAAANAGAAAILTDVEGEVQARRSGLPVLVVPRPRAVLGKLAAWVYGEPAGGLLLIGVTGTNGKTTTAHLAEAGLRAAGHQTGLVGTVETRIGDAATASVRTTPESTDLHALLAVMRERGVTAAVMEVSSHALAFGRVDGVLYDVAAFTNLSQDHLDFHRDMEDYFATKQSLFTPQRARRGVVNIDDDYGRRLAAESEIPVSTISASGRREADWMGTDAVLGAAESALTALGPGGVSVRIHVGMPGRYNLENALLAVVALATAGIPVEEAAAGVGACPGVPGRMERIDTGQPFLAVVDYAHTPDAIATALATLREVTKGRLVAVVGCGGDRDRAKRPLMGEVAARGADVLVITDDNPRSEDPAAIRAAALAGATSVPGPERAELAEVSDRSAAIAYAVRLAGPRDTVVILGKGHEQGQEIRGAVMPFDDRAMLRAALTEMMSGDSPTHARPGSVAAGGMGSRSSAQASVHDASLRGEAP
jgi:UDP-N-acetylmuramoyl-L-alanyl-D-glutamate--2,6-diaminopimelate ligase